MGATAPLFLHRAGRQMARSQALCLKPCTSAAAQVKEQELRDQQRELRQALLMVGNPAAADALRVQPMGFEWACNFKELSMDITAERIFEELSAANTAHVLPLNFSTVPGVRPEALYPASCALNPSPS